MKSFKIETAKEREEEQAKIQKLQEEKIRNIEKNRTAIEKFKVKELGLGWSILPGLLAFALLIYVFVDYRSTEELNWVVLSLVSILLVLVGQVASLKEQWQQRLKYKHEILVEDPGYKWVKYEEGNLYTDSQVEYLVYLLGKPACYLSSVAIVVIVGIMLFTWLGTISIAPTTIIIILLIIIIINQNKNR